MNKTNGFLGSGAVAGNGAFSTPILSKDIPALDHHENGEHSSCTKVCPSLDQLTWPALAQLELPDAVQRTRHRGIGGSDANIILSGDQDAILDLWHQKRGTGDAVDLSDRLPVALGCWTEPFNRQWYEKLTGQKVKSVGVSISCSTYVWRRCTLDGFVEETRSIWEAKHTSAFGKPEEVLERYMPQLQHNMAVARAERAILSVIFGNHKFEIFEIGADWLYQLDLLQAEEEFWACVLDGNEPVPAPLPPPPKPIGTREVCLEGNNAWASAAVDWLDNRKAAKLHSEACSLIKGLVEPDVSRAFGHGIEAKRSKSGAVLIREMAR